MDIRLDGKTFLITGGTQGVGHAIALEAAASGAVGIMITGRDPQRGERVVGELQSLGVTAGFVAADLGHADAPGLVVEAALATLGRLDGLVNAAALTDRGSVAGADAAFFDRMMAVNTRAPLFLMQGVIRHLMARKAPGAIVNIQSINAHGGTPELAVYAASKAALSVLTKNAAFSHRHDRIRVNGINLGWADTPAEREMQAVTLGQGEGWLEAAESRLPFGRLIKVGDVARLAVFLLSDATIPMTGAVIDQDQDIIIGLRA